MITTTELQEVLLALGDNALPVAEDLLRQAPLDEYVASQLLDAVRAGATPRDAMLAVADVLRRSGVHRDLVNECHRAAYYAGDAWAEDSRNELYAFFLANKSRWAADKWNHYFGIYERHLSPFRGRPVRVLEIGVYHGGGLAMLAHYLGSEAELVGVDVDPAARRSAHPWPVMLGDQADEGFLAEVAAEHGPFDIVIDDGGHTTRQQIASITALFPHLAERGVYLVEDTHTSYWADYVDSEQTFMQWTQARIDDLNGYHHGTAELSLWTTQVDSISCYDSVVVFAKATRQPPFAEVSGAAEHLRRSRDQESALIQARIERDRVNQELNDTNQELNKVNHRLNEANQELNKVNHRLNEANSSLDAGNRALDRINMSLDVTNQRLTDANERLTQDREVLTQKLAASHTEIGGLQSELAVARRWPWGRVRGARG